VRRLAIGLAALCSAVVSCGSKGSVAVTTSLDSPQVAILQSSALAASLGGGFSLYLELGAYAPSGTNVTPQIFNLVKPTDQSSLLVLHATSSPPPPFHLEPAAKSTVAFTITDQMGSSMQVIAPSELTAICQAKTVQIAGSITDTASGNPTPVTSSPFDVTGCP